MDIEVVGVKFDNKRVIVDISPLRTEDKDNAMIEFKATNNKIDATGTLTVTRKEFEENVSNLEQLIKSNILG